MSSEDFVTITKFNRESQEIYNELDELKNKTTEKLKDIHEILDSLKGGASKELLDRISSLEKAISTVINDLNELKEAKKETVRGF